MFAKESLIEQFEELGVDVSNDVLDKCLEIGLIYQLEDAQEFVEQWMSYSISNLGGAEPTVDYLKDMEIKEFQNKIKSNCIKSDNSAAKSGGNLQVYNDSDDDEMTNDLLGSYVCVTPKVDKKSASRLQHTTPDITKTVFSPVSYSPLTSRTRTVGDPSKSGNTVYNFGNYSSASQQLDSANKGHIIVRPYADFKHITQDTKYLTSSIVANGLLDANRVFEIGREISTKYLKSQAKSTTSQKSNDEEEENEVSLFHCDEQTQEIVTCLGRIYCEKSKLDNKSCIFVGFDEIRTRLVNLDFSKVKMPVSVFPGQTCLIRGNNPRGDNFYVEKIFAERELENSESPTTQQLEKCLSIVVASSPFTTDDNMLYEHLNKLMEYCQNNKPDILILTGSFLSAKSHLILDIATSIDEHFEKMLMGILETVGNDTQICIVSSSDDISGSGVYPTHPYIISKTHPNLHLLPDPCILDVNGVNIGLTSTDICQHITDAEFSLNAGGDKIRRIVNYMFHQKSFYPLYPPRMPHDVQLINEYCTINKIPNIMVVPSDLKYFMRDINNCLCINPGRLVEEETGGTFARIIVQPQQTQEEIKNITSYISGQIVRI